MNILPSSDETRRIQKLAFLLAILLGSIAVWIQLYMTSNGAGVSPDSVKYISVARNLANGNGLVHLADDGGFIPLTLWPPLYPIMLSAGALINIDPWQFGRYINAVAFGLNILVFQGLILKATDRNLVVSLFGGLILILSPVILEVHTWIWTEPVAILLGFSSLLFLDRLIRSGRNVDLVIISLLLSLGMLVRYAGVVFPMTVVIIICIFPREINIRERYRRLLITVFIIAIPQLFLMLRNRSLQSGMVGRIFGFYFAPLGWMIDDFLDVIRTWTIPGRIGPPIDITLAVIIMLLWLVLISLALFGRMRSAKNHEPSSIIIPLMLYLFTILSIFPIILVNLLFWPGVHVDKRILSLAYCSGTLLSIILYATELPSLNEIGWTLKNRQSFLSLLWKLAIGGAFLVIVAMNTIHATDWIRNAHLDGRGFAHFGWQQSKVIDYLEHHDNVPLLISNVPDVIYFFTGNPAMMMPSTTEEITRTVEEIMDRNYQGKTQDLWIVFFRTPLRRFRVPSEIQIASDLDVTPVYGWEEGSIYSLVAE